MSKRQITTFEKLAVSRNGPILNNNVFLVSQFIQTVLQRATANNFSQGSMQRVNAEALRITNNHHCHPRIQMRN